MTRKILIILKDWLGFPLILFLCYFLIVKPYFEKKDREIIANREYSIAHVLKSYAYGEKSMGGQYGNGTSLASVDFSYTFKGRMYKASCPLGRNSEFDKAVYDYLLIVDKDNPERFILKFDYPIINRNDFQEVIKKYERENTKNAPK